MRLIFVNSCFLREGGGGGGIRQFAAVVWSC